MLCLGERTRTVNADATFEISKLSSTKGVIICTPSDRATVVRRRDPKRVIPHPSGFQSRDDCANLHDSAVTPEM